MKYLFTFLIPSLLFATNQSWQDFENNAYIGGAYSYNNTNTGGFGNVSSSSPMVDIGATILMQSNIWANIEGEGNFLSGGAYVSNWYNLTGKVGYSINSNKWNFIPYGVIGVGNGGVYFSSSNSINYGAGLLSEISINANWLLFADINYQFQSFSGQINTDFNKNVINNQSTYSINGTPSTYQMEFGAKYITNNGLYISPFVKYQNYNQTFTQSSGNINYGSVNPNTNQIIVGVNFGVVL